MAAAISTTGGSIRVLHAGVNDGKYGAAHGFSGKTFRDGRCAQALPFRPAFSVPQLYVGMKQASRICFSYAWPIITNGLMLADSCDDAVLPVRTGAMKVFFVCPEL